VICRRLLTVSLTALPAFAQQTMLDGAGPQSRRIEVLWWFFLALMTLVFVIVLIVLGAALLRRRSDDSDSPASEQRLGQRVGAATIATVLILFGLVVISTLTGKAMARLENPRTGMTIQVTGWQWWWDFQYVDNNAARVLNTANEIHIPVGRPVQIRGSSQDVIHSFWVPNLNGKIDLIPSRITTEWIQADRPGRFRGQCAEFCGLQHAHMALWIVAEEPQQFETWMTHQLEPAMDPADPVAIHGREVFLNRACVLCHSIRGTSAAGTVAPDLTHFGSRSTLAAGSLPNNPTNLERWLKDPQAVKPGNHMPNLPLENAELQALITYLESLQ
jgi:cytochrome c oxidase subunit 2